MSQIHECGKALMLMAKKAGVKRINSKKLRKQVEDVAFEEVSLHNQTMGLNPEKWESEENDENEKLAAFEY